VRTHSGRSFGEHPLEDSCPCPKEACGLVDLSIAVDECDQHRLTAARTMRQGHPASACPSMDSVLRPAVEKAWLEFMAQLDAIAVDYEVPSKKMVATVDDICGDQPAYAEWVAESWEFAEVTK
jgi:hypothetical protein